MVVGKGGQSTSAVTDLGSTGMEESTLETFIRLRSVQIAKVESFEVLVRLRAGRISGAERQGRIRHGTVIRSHCRDHLGMNMVDTFLFHVVEPKSKVPCANEGCLDSQRLQ